MEPSIVALARRMAEAKDAELYPNARPDPEYFDRQPESYRRGWVRAAIVARPDLVEGEAVPMGHWLAGVLPIRDALPVEGGG